MDEVLIERGIDFTPTSGRPRRLLARIWRPERDPEADAFRARMGYAADDPRGVGWRAKVELDGARDLAEAPGEIVYAPGSDEADTVIAALALLHVQLTNVAAYGAVELQLPFGTWSLTLRPYVQDECDVEESETEKTMSDWLDAYDVGERCLKAIVRKLDAGITKPCDIGLDIDTVDPAMETFERAIVRHVQDLDAGTAMGGPKVDEQTIADVRRLRARLREWVAGDPLSSEIHEMADRLIAVWAGENWREKSE